MKPHMKYKEVRHQSRLNRVGEFYEGNGYETHPLDGRQRTVGRGSWD